MSVVSVTAAWVALLESIGREGRIIRLGPDYVAGQIMGWECVWGTPATIRSLVRLG
jgi:hypothetical protein